MSKPVNTVAVGAFVIGAFLILFIILFSLSEDLFERNVEYSLVVFDGSLKGLTQGAPVAFKGVPIGEVVSFDVYLDSDTFEALTPVVMRINRDRIRRSDEKSHSESDMQTMIDKGLRAQLQVQSLLTGQLYVQLDFHPDSPARYRKDELEKYDVPPDMIVIPTMPREMEKLSSSLDDLDLAALADDMKSIMSGLRQIINAPDTQALPENLTATIQAIEQLSNGIDAELQALSPELNQLVADAAGTMGTLNKNMPGLSADAQKTLEDMSATLETAQKALERLDHTLSDDSAVIYDMRKAAKEIGAAGRALQSLSESLETHPESLIKGKRAQ